MTFQGGETNWATVPRENFADGFVLLQNTEQRKCNSQLLPLAEGSFKLKVVQA